MGTCGALMFVEPEDAPGVLLALEGNSLCPYHIVVDASLEYLLDEILSGFSFQRRPKRKSGASGRRSLCWEESRAIGAKMTTNSGESRILDPARPLCTRFEMAFGSLF